MLSYLKEGTHSADTDPTEAAEPLSENSGHDFLTTAHHGRNAKQGTLVLIILFVVGAAVVWWMIKKITPAQAAAAAQEDNTKIDQVLAQLQSFKTEVHGQIDTMFNRFYQASELGQIRVNELKKNPFKLEMSQAAEDKTEEDEVAKRLQMLQDEINRQAGRLQLWSVTERAQGACCMINDKVLYLGDTIEGFKIIQIQNQRVVLEREGIQIELKMQE